MASYSKIKDSDFNKIIDMILDGESYRSIADKLKVNLSTLYYFINKPERSARTHEAVELSAIRCDEQAYEILLKADKDDIMRARELAQHLRWKAKVRSPKKYGDKQTVEHKGTAPISISIQHYGNKELKTIEPDVEQIDNK